MAFVDSCYAFLLLLWAPFRGILRAVYGVFARKPERSMDKEIVLITGAAHGLGRGMSLEFARLGATVVCWDINESGNAETVRLAAKISSKEKAIHAYRCDISNREEVVANAERVVKEVGHVTILINNAGILTSGRLENYPPEDIVRLVNTNFISHFWTIEAFLPYMKSINSGQIVCIASMAVLSETIFMIPYASTKHAITGLMYGLREELRSTNYDGIRVTIAHPYFTHTHPMFESFKEKGMDLLNETNVVTEIVEGVKQKQSEFSIPRQILPLSRFLWLYPSDVRRAAREANGMREWRNILKDTKKPLSTR